MNVLITGNSGYVGSVLVPYLRGAVPACRLIGFDAGWFQDKVIQNIAPPEARLDWQVMGDVRDLRSDQLLGVDAIIHLAAVSNDPIGKQFEAATEEINLRATVRLAEAARVAGVKRFIFASSCSVYGAGNDKPKGEYSVLDPQTAYARSKVEAERSLIGLSSTGFKVFVLRFATACGSSPRPRLDLVLNDFVATALATKKITVLSDGSPWRPLIHVGDMARAIHWALASEHSYGQPINVGSDKMNFQVKDLAAEVARQTGAEVSINTDAAPDTRSYRVDFSLFQKAAPLHQPVANLEQSVQDLVEFFKMFGVPPESFRTGDEYIRLNTLNKLVQEGHLTQELRRAQ